MANETKNKFLSGTWKAHQTYAKYGSIFGLGIWCFSSKAAVMAKEENPDADIFEVMGEHFGTMLETGFEYGPEGLTIIFTESVALVTDTIVPFLGTTISAISAEV